MRRPPDEQLRAAVLDRLASDACTAAQDLRVGVLNGIIHLAGWVGSMDIRAAAERIAWQVPGARGVVNRIDAPGAPNPARTVNLELDDGDWFDVITP